MSDLHEPALLAEVKIEREFRLPAFPEALLSQETVGKGHRSEVDDVENVMLVAEPATHVAILSGSFNRPRSG
ncbi:MAG: hypothetical protein H6Q83_1481 [Deltaproteobacteria bacterium]|nr:hypothetical protein [Deltaproteobacteria bacterium]